ncbi:MAG: hypothetical protein QM731_28520 [Chitinophagaceae bacterium]
MISFFILSEFMCYVLKNQQDKVGQIPAGREWRYFPKRCNFFPVVRLGGDNQETTDNSGCGYATQAATEGCIIKKGEFAETGVPFIEARPQKLLTSLKNKTNPKRYPNSGRHSIYNFYMVNPEKQIADEIAKWNGVTVAQLSLRFDKVVVRLFGHLRTAIEEAIPDDETVIVTVTAPIKLPSKTAQALEEQIRHLLKSGTRNRKRKLSIFQNEVSIKIAGASSKRSVKLIGLVHHRDTDPAQLLDLATHWLFDHSS